MIRFCLLLALLLSAFGQTQSKRILYVTHSAGFRHDCLPLSQQVIREVGSRSGFEVIATEDLSVFDDLSRFDAIVFFTSGELALSSAQKARLLEFIRGGRGFAGFHSATDTFYTWPEYGELIGARFDGHPWTQPVRIKVEDSAHPAVQHLSPAFTITEEIYQFREFSRERVHVLFSLDTSSVDVKASGVNRTDGDFALAWTKTFGSGRVFYTALGHFEDTWRDARFQTLIQQALRWIVAGPSIAAIGNAASMQPAMSIAPGSLVSIYGSDLTAGVTESGWNETLAGTRVLLNGKAARLLYASPSQINLYTPQDLADPVELAVDVPQAQRAIATPKWAANTPGVFVMTVDGPFATVWATGLYNVASPRVLVNGVNARVLFAGSAPGFFGLDQVNIELPASVNPPYFVEVRTQ